MPDDNSQTTVDCIRPACKDDEDVIWSIIGPVFAAGETYAAPRDWSRAQALAYWCAADHRVFVLEEAGTVLGTYYLRANQRGGGAHVANCGYITAHNASGRGIAARMCEHSLNQARREGFRAMQFNFVISTNTRAIALWQRLGFSVVGRLPRAFEHPAEGEVDALVMHRFL